MIRLRTWFVWVLLAIWFGGFTFYAAVVVPIGSRLIGTTEQGFITQRVTVWLNLIGCLTILMLAFDWWLSGEFRRSRLNRAILVILVISCLALILIHQSLGRLIDVDTMTIQSPRRFYRIHQAYLWCSVAQWFASLFVWYRYAQKTNQNVKTG